MIEDDFMSWVAQIASSLNIRTILSKNGFHNCPQSVFSD
jgi:hypothetical protein